MVDCQPTRGEDSVIPGKVGEVGYSFSGRFIQGVQLLVIFLLVRI